ncbi:tetratricopeptide repeat protein [Hyalangium gracile]|uniref:tetratricopeptide repeat protein n=1 Tax=Hyalangium gracile TaxID=394092 RepID=UPI001CCF54FA|nr:tetratricopeptide repeat protein [Hyalangium gracile]
MQEFIHRAGLIVLLLLLPLLVHAQEDSKLRGYLLSVNRLYAALEYEKALEQLTRAKRFAHTVEDDVTLSLYEGIILADMNRLEDSTAAFKAALFLNPEAKLPLEVSPKVAKRFESVRQEVRSEIAKAQQGPRPSASQAPRKSAPPPKAGNQQGDEALSQSMRAHAALPADADSTASTTNSQRSALRPQVLIPAISGGVLMLAGGTSWVLSRHERARLRGNDVTLATREDVHRSASRGRTYQAVGVGLLGAGLAGVGVAAGLFFSMPASTVSLDVTTDGTSAFVSGRWP